MLRAFRFVLVFIIVWAFWLTAALILLPRWVDVSSSHRYEIAFVGSLFATFVVTLWWLFIREILTTGSRGLLVARLFVSVVVVAATLLGAMYWSGFYTEARGQLFGLVFTAAAMFYVRFELDRHEDNELAAVIQKTFPKGIHCRVLELLERYGVLPHERERERVQLAILKLGEGNEEKLRNFVAAAKRDYRDILFWADNPEEAKLDTPEKRERFRKMCEKFGIKPPQNL